MSGVDQADQLRENEPGTRRVRRGGWHALFLYIFNTVLVNLYLLSLIETQGKFRELLYLQLLEVGSSTRKRKWAVPRPDSRLYTAQDKQDGKENEGQEALAHERVHR